MSHRPSKPRGQRRRSFHVPPAQPQRVARASPHGLVRIAQFTENNPAVAVTLVGIIVYAIAGFAHLYFYGSLGVSLDEIGLGYTAILSKAALVLSLTVLFLATVLAFTSFIVFFLIGLYYTTESKFFRRIGRMGRWETPILLTIGVVFILGLWRESAITVSVLVLILLFSSLKTAIKIRKRIASPSPLQVSLAAAMMLWIVVAVAAGAGAALSVHYGDSESIPPIWVVSLALIILSTYSVFYWLFPLAYASWHKRHGSTAVSVRRRFATSDPMTLWNRWRLLWVVATDWVFSRFPHRRVLWVTASMLILAGVMTFVSFVARDDLRRVIDGQPRNSLASQVAHSPITCVTFTWLEDAELQNVPDRLLYLGRADGRVVLYVPRQGPVRLPAASVALTPVATPNTCAVDGLS
jgi:hypothetical protein